MDEVELVKVEKVDENLVKEVAKRILSVLNPVKIILFGSWAYGKPHRGSDLDILIVIDDDSIQRYDATVKAYSALTGILIPKDVVVVTPRMVKEWENVPQAFVTTIVRKGRVVYERKD